MRPIKLIFALLLACGPAGATYVSSGHQDFVGGTSTTTCNPNAGGVTAGNYEVMFVQANGSTSGTVSSTRVPSWTLKESAPSTIYIFIGIATSSGAESITFTWSSSSGLTGSACGEYTTQFNASHQGGASDTIAASSGDVVAVSTSGGGGIAAVSPLVHREYISIGATHYAELADQPVGSPGNYTSTFTNALNVFSVAFAAPASKRSHSAIIKYHLPNPRRSPLLLARIAWRKELDA